MPADLSPASVGPDVGLAHSTRGMVTSPHDVATRTGLDVLRSGGNAVEAAIAIGGFRTPNAPLAKTPYVVGWQPVGQMLSCAANARIAEEGRGGARAT